MRTSGVLMPISSLPSDYGIGTLGKESKRFIDFLERAGQTFWQILPICPTSYGDSPYQSFASFAGNPYFIDLKILMDQGLLKKKECDSFIYSTHPNYIDYGRMYETRYQILRIASERFIKNIPDEYYDFCDSQADWLDDYALYIAIKNAMGGQAWMEWPEGLKKRHVKAIKLAQKEYEAEITFYKVLQYWFYSQWQEIKEYANSKGIKIIGDVPIYVAMDSADVWANPKQFYLDKDLNPIDVAGCPPDAFSADGQLWGNPLFRWDAMKRDGYAWWIKRVKAMSDLYDIIRIDHFRGFDTYFAIPYGDSTARNGEWRKGPGMNLFNALRAELGELPIICEDLGDISDSVRQLLAETGFPGMKVLQFAFDGGADNLYLPHNHVKNCVIYTGTHDNDTSMGWLKNCSPYTKKHVVKYLNLTKVEGYNWGIIRAAMSSVADYCIIPFQDLIGVGSEARINLPSTFGDNWKWRASKSDINAKIANKLSQYTYMYDRQRR